MTGKKEGRKERKKKKERTNERTKEKEKKKTTISRCGHVYLLFAEEVMLVIIPWHVNQEAMFHKQRERAKPRDGEPPRLPAAWRRASERAP